jgi:hypothetical protein
VISNGVPIITRGKRAFCRAAYASDVSFIRSLPDMDVPFEYSGLTTFEIGVA